jgi:hypothetical protein
MVRTSAIGCSVSMPCAWTAEVDELADRAAARKLPLRQKLVDHGHTLSVGAIRLAENASCEDADLQRLEVVAGHEDDRQH